MIHRLHAFSHSFYLSIFFSSPSSHPLVIYHTSLSSSSILSAFIFFSFFSQTYSLHMLSIFISLFLSPSINISFPLSYSNPLCFYSSLLPLYLNIFFCDFLLQDLQKTFFNMFLLFFFKLCNHFFKYVDDSTNIKSWNLKVFFCPPKIDSAKKM